MASRTPTKVYGPIKSFNSLCRFCKKPFLQNSSSIPIFSVTQRQECKGVQLSNLLSDYGIFVQDDSSLSSRSCPRCARRILTSCKTLQEVKQVAQAGPSPRNPSVKSFIFLFPSSRAWRSCRAPREISRSPRLAHKAPVMQATRSRPGGSRKLVSAAVRCAWPS